MSRKLKLDDSYKVLSTTDYDKFKIAEWNRDVKHVETLKESIRNYGFLMVPILVNEDMEIIDGQGRFFALKELGLPIYYIVQPGLNKEHCMALNYRQTNWTENDYIKSYALEIVDYMYLQLLMKQYPMFPSWVCATAIMGKSRNGEYSKALKTGKFKCSAVMYEKAAKKLEWLSGLYESIKPIKGRSQYLYEALLFCCNVPAISNAKLARKFINNAYTIEGVINTEDAIRHLERIYNRGGKKQDYVDISNYYKMSAREK